MRFHFAFAIVASGLLTAVWTASLGAQTTGSKTANLRVSAEVVANCVVTVVDVAFGRYDPIAANATTPLDAEGAVNLNCTRGVVAAVSLDGGLHTRAGSRARAMTLATGTSPILYLLTTDAARTVPFNQPVSVSFLSTTTQNLPVYGRILPGQSRNVGSYSDTVVVTVAF